MQSTALLLPAASAVVHAAGPPTMLPYPGIFGHLAFRVDGQTETLFTRDKRQAAPPLHIVVKNGLVTMHGAVFPAANALRRDGGR